MCRGGAALIVVCVVAAGCGRIAFDPVGDGGSSGGDGNDASTVTCWPQWMAHSISVGAPRRLTEIEDGSDESDASITGDGRTLYFTHNQGGIDVFRATRPALGAMWTSAARVAELSSSSDDTRFGVAPDGLSGVLASDRAMASNFDLYLSERASTAVPFNPPSSGAFVQVNSATMSDFDPELSANGLRVYWAPVQANGRQHILTARRAQPGDAFVNERELTELTPPGTPQYSDPALSPDELVIAYAGSSPPKLFYATRTDPDGTFGTPIPIPTVDTSNAETDAELSADGCELYFTSDRTGAKKLYVATVQ